VHGAGIIKYPRAERNLLAAIVEHVVDALERVAAVVKSWHAVAILHRYAA